MSDYGLFAAAGLACAIHSGAALAVAGSGRVASWAARDDEDVAAVRRDFRNMAVLIGLLAGALAWYLLRFG